MGQSSADITLENNNNDEKKLNARVEFLRFWNRYVDFLPKDDPETIIWSDDIAKSMLGVKGLPKEISGEANIKNKFAALSMKLTLSTTSDDIFYLQKAFIKRFCDEEGDDYKTLLSILEKFKELNDETNA